jgi:hypothetical protein
VQDLLQLCIDIFYLYLIVGQAWVEAWIAKSGKGIQKYIGACIMGPCTYTVMWCVKKHEANSENSEVHMGNASWYLFVILDKK